MRKLIVESCAVMPTSGTRPRAVRSMACASMSDSPLPNRLILRWTMHAIDPAGSGAAAGRPAPGTSVSFREGRRAGRRPWSRPIFIQMPGAVPTRVGKRLGPPRKKRLDAVSLGHRAIAAGEHRRDRRQRIGVLDQRHAGDTGPGPRGSGRPAWDRGRRSSPPGRPGSKAVRKTAEMVVQHVAQRRVERDRDAQRSRAAG